MLPAIDPAIDQVTLNFDASSLTLLNIILGLVMLGVALDLRWADFRRVVRAGRPAALGLTVQFLVLPALTFGLVSWLQPQPSMALGLMLVASCPGGSISNFLTHLARGNTALSVSLSAVSTLASTIMTPLNLGFWASRYPPTSELLQKVALDPWQMVQTVAFLLGLPIAIGLLIGHRWPGFAARARRPFKIFSLIAFALFVVLALAANFQFFMQFIATVATIVCLHNALALASGYFASMALGLAEADRRAVAIEVGIQNSGLGLLLIFNFFDGLGGMAIVAAWWGIWHLVAGGTLAFFWSRRPLTPS